MNPEFDFCIGLKMRDYFIMNNIDKLTDTTLEIFNLKTRIQISVSFSHENENEKKFHLMEYNSMFDEFFNWLDKKEIVFKRHGCIGQFKSIQHFDLYLIQIGDLYKSIPVIDRLDRLDRLTNRAIIARFTLDTGSVITDEFNIVRFYWNEVNGFYRRY